MSFKVCLVLCVGIFLARAGSANEAPRWDVDKLVLGYGQQKQNLKDLRDLLNANRCSVTVGKKTLILTSAMIREAGLISVDHKTFPSAFPFADKVKNHVFQLSLRLDKDGNRVLAFQTATPYRVKAVTPAYYMYDLVTAEIRMHGESPSFTKPYSITVGKMASYTLACEPSTRVAKVETKEKIDEIFATIARETAKLLALKLFLTENNCDVTTEKNRTFRLHPHMIRRSGLMIANQLIGPGAGLNWVSNVPSPRAIGYSYVYQLSIESLRGQNALRFQSYEPTPKRTHAVSSELIPLEKGKRIESSLGRTMEFRLACEPAA